MIIKNIWNKITIYCGCHAEPVEMVANTKGSTLFYSCPKYYEQNRSPNEHACANRIKLDDYQAAVEHLCSRIAENEANNSIEDLTGYRWSRRGIDFRVIKYTNDDIHIMVANKTALKH